MSWLPKQRVLVPIDFSEESLEALDLARHFVESAEDLHVIHVLPQLSPMEPGVIWGEVDDESRRRHALAALKKQLDEREFGGSNLEIRFGGAAREIAEFAQEIKAELIVLPSHGRTGAAHLFIGSTSERVVRYAHCPVLVLRK